MKTVTNLINCSLYLSISFYFLPQVLFSTVLYNHYSQRKNFHPLSFGIFIRLFASFLPMVVLLSATILNRARLNDHFLKYYHHWRRYHIENFKEQWQEVSHLLSMPLEIRSLWRYKIHVIELHWNIPELSNLLIERASVFCSFAKKGLLCNTRNICRLISILNAVC